MDRFIGINVFEIIFYLDAEKELYEFEASMQSKTFTALDKLEAKGDPLKAPHTEIIRDVFLSQEQERRIQQGHFLLLPKAKIYILRSFIKKTRNT